MIDRETTLAGFLPNLRSAPWVALDTEADSLHCYPEKLCLLQISIPEHDVLVDPLDLSPQSFSRRSQEKVRKTHTTTPTFSLPFRE